VKFFFDNNVAPAMAEAIAALTRSQGIEIVHLKDRFPTNTPDPVWIAEIAAEGFVIISGDPRISRNPANRAAWLESGMTAFFFGDGWASKKLMVQAAELVRWWPTIVDTVKVCTPGSGFVLPVKGSTPTVIYQPDRST